MHFWVSAARVSLPDIAPGHFETSAARWPRKIGTNWFMPALVNSRFGESGSRLDEGTMVCSFDLKKSKKDCRISALVMLFIQFAARDRKDRKVFAANKAGRLGEAWGQREGNFCPALITAS